MTALREAAIKALEAMDYLHRTGDTQVFDLCHRETTEALRAALAEPEDWELRRLREELERCKQTCAAISEAWREEAALAEPVQERNFCPRCGKRTNNIHTCTPP